MSRIILATIEIDSTSSNDIYSGELTQASILQEYSILSSDITSKKKKWLAENNISVKTIEQINYSIFKKTIKFYVELDELQATDYYLRF